MKRILLLAACWFVLAHPAKAQVDPHFTQYYMYPLFLNPALTGVISEGDIRGSAIYRNQWSNISNPFSTVGVSGDMLFDNNWGIGVNLMNQSAGSGGYNNTDFHVNVANNNIRFGYGGSQHLSIGLQLGVINKYFDKSKLQFGDQYISNAFSASNSTTAFSTIQSLSQAMFDAGAGVAYFDATPDKKVNVYGGFSMAHITQPDDKFTADGSKLPIRYTIHAGARIIASETLMFYPNMIYMLQGNAYEAVPGVHAEMKANENTSFLLGANYRVQDAINAFAGIYYKNYAFGLSYDINTSDLNKVSKTVNSFELSLSYIALRNTRTETRYFKCPRF